MEENKTENEKDIIRNFLFLKPVYNIDLFTDIPKEKNINSKNIYLKFYNEHTKKKVLHNENNTICSNHYYEQNIDYIKQKQLKNKIKKQNEEKLKIQIEKEKSLEYRQKRMNKLYSSKNILNNNNNNIIVSKSKKFEQIKNNKIKRCSSLPNKYNINEINNNKKNNNKKYDKGKKSVNLSFDEKQRSEKGINRPKINIKFSKLPKDFIVMTQSKYNKKLKTMLKLSKIYENELKLLKNNKKDNIEKDNLNLLLNSINDEIDKYKNKIDILIIE